MAFLGPKIYAMNQELKKQLSHDEDGLLTYEYIANHIGNCDSILSELVDNMTAVDATGQFMVSAARYLAAIDKKKYRRHIERLVAASIDKDRERRYIPDLLPSLWGADYEQRAEALCMTDNNFRRIYKRINPSTSL